MLDIYFGEKILLIMSMMQLVCMDISLHVEWLRGLLLSCFRETIRLRQHYSQKVINLILEKKTKSIGALKLKVKSVIFSIKFLS